MRIITGFLCALLGFISVFLIGEAFKNSSLGVWFALVVLLSVTWYMGYLTVRKTKSLEDKNDGSTDISHNITLIPITDDTGETVNASARWDSMCEILFEELPKYYEWTNVDSVSPLELKFCTAKNDQVVVGKKVNNIKDGEELNIRVTGHKECVDIVIALLRSTAQEQSWNAGQRREVIAKHEIKLVSESIVKELIKKAKGDANVDKNPNILIDDFHRHFKVSRSCSADEYGDVSCDGIGRSALGTRDMGQDEFETWSHAMQVLVTYLAHWEKNQYVSQKKILIEKLGDATTVGQAEVIKMNINEHEKLANKVNGYVNNYATIKRERDIEFTLRNDISASNEANRRAAENAAYAKHLTEEKRHKELLSATKTVADNTMIGQIKKNPIAAAVIANEIRRKINRDQNN